MTGSFRKPELAAVDHVDVVDPLTINVVLKSPYSPLIAQFTDRAGMMVSPKAAKEAGDKFGLHPVCAGPYKFVERVQQDRIVFEKFADYWNKDNVHIDRVVFLPIVNSTVRLANLKSGALDLIERVLATDIKSVREDKALKLATALELGYQGLDINVGNGDAIEKSARPVRQSPPGTGPRDRSRCPEPGRVQRRIQARQPVGQPGKSLLPAGLSVPKRDVAKAKALMKEAGVPRHSMSTSWCRRAQKPRPSPKSFRRWPARSGSI